MNRPALVISMGMIIGIILGLYFNSIAFIIAIISACLLLKTNNKNIIIIFIVSMIISNIYVTIINKKYEEFYNTQGETFVGIGTIISDAEETEYNYRYTIKMNDNKKFILYVKKDNNVLLEYGNKIRVNATYSEPDSRRNYKGFNYSEYLKTQKIYGTLKTSNGNIEIIEKNNINIFSKFSHMVRNSIIYKARSLLSAEYSELLVGILLGEKKGISDEIIQNFKDSSLSHLLAVSGAHTTYIILGVSYVFSIIKIPKRLKYILTIAVLVFFMFITEFTPSVIRACLMSIFILSSKLLHKKADTLNSIAISLIIILVFNPFSILNIGLQLSYLRNNWDSFILKRYNKNIRKIYNNKNSHNACSYSICTDFNISNNDNEF